VKWGCDLQSEHERYITEEAFGGCPVIIRDYPKACYFSPSFSVLLFKLQYVEDSRRCHCKYHLKWMTMLMEE